jgi:acid phosphatase family membrane protein YuiD
MKVISPYFIAVVAAWFLAQGAKYLLVAIQRRRFDHLRQLYLSGNMPSAHTATVVALAVVVGMYNGFESALFAIAALFAGIVMYDAVMVRRSSGEQGVALQQLIKEQKSKVPLPRAAKGHQPLEVLVGAMLGVVIGLVVFLATK